jgi:Bacteriophage Sf6, terminase small subunit-like
MVRSNAESRLSEPAGKNVTRRILHADSEAGRHRPEQRGKASTYTEATAVEICRRMVEGESLRTICKAPGMPTFVTVFNWRRAHPEFLEQYARAREDQADALVEEMLDVARSALRAKSSEEAQGYRLNAEVSVRQMTDEQLNARLTQLLERRRETTTWPKRETPHE